MLKLSKTKNIAPKLTLQNLKKNSPKVKKEVIKLETIKSEENFQKAFYDFEESGYFISNGKVYPIIFPR